MLLFLEHSKSLEVLIFTMGKKFLKTLFSCYGWTYKKDKNKAGMGKFKNTGLLQNDGRLQRKAIASLIDSLFSHKVNYSNTIALLCLPVTFLLVLIFL